LAEKRKKEKESDWLSHAISTVAHRGKTQLNFSSEKQQSFREHNNLLENTTIF